MVTHSLTMLEKHLVYSGDSPPRNFTTNRVKRRSIKSEDPMSHRIIEKRRRDRMNNCLADLSRLIPPEYLKKGRGRIEKTEIIEMAIKHIGHLQNVIATTRFNENSNSSIPSPPAPSSIIPREPSSTPLNQPLTLKHYRMGYLECMSEAVHFLVEVQGYFANDSLCVQMINHLRKHCDKIINGNAYNFPKKQTGDLASSDTSGSPVNGAFNGSPPLALAHSAGSVSDDNQPNQSYPMDGYYSPKRYANLCCNSVKRQPSEDYPRYVESDGMDSENRSDSELHSNVIVKCQRPEKRKEDSKTYYGGERTCSRDCESRNGLGEPENYDGIPVKQENGSSQLRDMLTSPTSLTVVTSIRGNTSPMSNTSGLDIISASGVKNKCSEIQDGDHSDNQQKQSPRSDVNQVIMYKFKNNIKQRFSKEKRENPECDSVGDQLPVKKQKPEVDCHKCEENSLMKERLLLLDRTDTEDEEVFKLNNSAESESARKAGRFEPEIHNGDLSSRLNFGHRTNEKGALKRWEDPSTGFHHPQRPWALSPTPSLPQYAFKPPNGRYPTEYPSITNNSFNNLSITTDDPAGPGVPIFALHAKGSFYIPLTLDQAALAPFLTLLGLAKGSNNGVDEKKVLHPITISVNFQSHLIR